ncbi:hypothetical protein ScPMuIL_010255 [Solemya velum]
MAFGNSFDAYTNIDQNSYNSKPEALEGILEFVKRKNWSALTKSRIKTANRDFEELLKGVQLAKNLSLRDGGRKEPQSRGGLSDTSVTSRSDQRELETPRSYRMDDAASVSSRQSRNGYPEGRRHKSQAELEKTIHSQKVQIDDMATRMSKMASHKLHTNNPNVADLNDDNRPSKIAEKFSELYDNQWTEAFEELSRIMSEIDTIYMLLRIVRYAYKYCRDVAEEQIQAMEKNMQEVMLYPEKFHRPKSRMEYRSSKPAASAVSKADNKASYYSTQYRKEAAVASLFINECLPQIYKRNISPKIQQYSERCAELTWYMVVQDPPIEMYVLDEGHVDTDYFRFYTMSGTQVQYCVWPALRLYKHGQALLKGVLQAKCSTKVVDAPKRYTHEDSTQPSHVTYRPETLQETPCGIRKERHINGIVDAAGFFGQCD